MGLFNKNEAKILPILFVKKFHKLFITSFRRWKEQHHRKSMNTKLRVINFEKVGGEISLVLLMQFKFEKYIMYESVIALWKILPDMGFGDKYVTIAIRNNDNF